MRRRVWARTARGMLVGDWESVVAMVMASSIAWVAPLPEAGEGDSLVSVLEKWWAEGHTRDERVRGISDL